MAEPVNIDDLREGDKLTPEQVRELLARGGKHDVRGDPEKTQGVESVLEQKNLEYPLNNVDDYKGRIVFDVMKEAETDLGNVIGSIADIAKGGKEALKEEVRKVTESTNPSDTVEAIEGHRGNGNAVQTVATPNLAKPVGRRVSLYLPVGLQYRDAVSYDNMDLGGMGASAEAGLKSGGSAIGAIIQGGMKTLQAGLTGAANKDVAKVSAVKLVSALPDEVQGAFKSAAGVTSNPNTRVLFKAVNLRDFSFTFKFIPTSAKEAEEVKEIVKLFRTELYPENIKLDVPGGSSISLGYRFPNKFRINIEYNGEQIATKIKLCYLRDVSVTYNNTAMSMHSDGNFAETEMTLAFQESRTLNRKDVEEDGF